MKITSEQLSESSSTVDAVVNHIIQHQHDVLGVFIKGRAGYFVIGTHCGSLKQHVRFNDEQADWTIADIMKAARLQGFGFRKVVHLVDRCPIYDIVSPDSI